MSPLPPKCERTFDGGRCDARGAHRCAPRVAHVSAFFAELLVHTKGRWSRKPFRLLSWQLDDIMAPLFGEVVYDDEAQCYRRKYRIGWVEVARKNGKSELLAGIALYLLVSDDEEGAEVYGCAADRDQARKVYDVAERMVQLSPVLSQHLGINKQAKRIYRKTGGSYYEVVAADAAGNLGHNPHGVVFDEVLTQRNGDLWNAMRTGMGTRVQPLMVAATTAGDDPQSFGKRQHDEMMRISVDPTLAPHVFVYARNLDSEADPWDEDNWRQPNPALGEFLSLQSLRDEAMEARSDPSKENAFRQFRLNQWVSQSTRWMPMHLWDSCVGALWPRPDWGREQLLGRRAYAGFDLSAKFDLTAWCLMVPAQGDGEPAHLLWRFWLPEAGLERLDALNDRRFTPWAQAGWLTITEGSVIDYEQVLADVAVDAADFQIVGADCDEWSMWPIIGKVAGVLGLDPEAGDVTAYRNTYEKVSPGMTELMGLVKSDLIVHHANPVARFCFDVCEVRHATYDPNLVRPDKPERGRDRSRVDAVAAAAMAVNAWRARENVEPARSAYEDEGLMVV